MMNYRSLFINFRWCNRKTWRMNHHRRLPSVWRPTFSASQVRFAHKIQPRVTLVTENQPVNGSSDTVKNIFNFQSALTCCLSCHWKHEDRFWEGASVCVGQGGAEWCRDMWGEQGRLYYCLVLLDFNFLGERFLFYTLQFWLRWISISLLSSVWIPSDSVSGTELAAPSAPVLQIHADIHCRQLRPDTAGHWKAPLERSGGLNGFFRSSTEVFVEGVTFIFHT